MGIYKTQALLVLWDTFIGGVLATNPLNTQAVLTLLLRRKVYILPFYSGFCPKTTLLRGSVRAAFPSSIN
jgi:hypothetical protein